MKNATPSIGAVIASCALGTALACSAPQAPPDAPPVPVSAPAPLDDQQVIRRFHEIFYANQDTWPKNTWFGLITLQNPMDAWITQEILVQERPDFFIECGAAFGGSAAMWATILEQVNPDARVITIDILDQMQQARKLPIVQRRVDFMLGSSTDPALVAKIAERVKGKKVVVLLDSDHSAPHVLRELELYAPLVNVGSYIIVQDSNVNGHPVLPNFAGGQGGPWEAVEQFLKTNGNFEIDKTRERLLLTFVPNGYLKRIK